MGLEEKKTERLPCNASAITSKRLRPRLDAVERKERILANETAKSKERKPPEIFCLHFIIRKSRSAWLLVNGTSGSVRNRKTSRL